MQFFPSPIFSWRVNCGDSLSQRARCSKPRGRIAGVRRLSFPSPTLLLLTLFAATIFASWAISFWIPQRLQFGSHRTYGIRFDRGTIQLRFERLTDVRYDANGKATVVEVGLHSHNPTSPSRPAHATL